MSIFRIIAFFLVASFVSFSLANSNIFANAQIENIINNTATSEAVTSLNDAILKSLIIISQVAVLGIVFNYFFFNIFLNKKRDNILSQSNQNNAYLWIKNLNLKRVTCVVIICCISIIIFSTASILLQSHQLSQNLDVDILSAFDILDTTSVGQVWTLRIVTSSATIGGMLIYYATDRKFKNANQTKNESLDKATVNKISLTSNIPKYILLLIVIALTSINLFSNSMVSHSNSLRSFSTFAVAMDWVHFMAVSIWIGGLFYLSLVLVKNLKPIDDHHHHHNDKSNIVNTVSTGSTVSNGGVYDGTVVSVHSISIALIYFSFIVIIALCIIGISGLYLGYVHLQDLNSVFNTQYGHILVLKLALAFPLIFIGRFNQLKIFGYASLTSNFLKENTKNTDNKFLIQQYHQKRTSLFKRLNRSLKIESFLGITVLIVASFLSVTSPPSLEAVSQDEFTTRYNNDISESNNSFFFYLVITLVVIICTIGIINYRKNQKQIKLIFALMHND